jgi:hypothetical protein
MKRSPALLVLTFIVLTFFSIPNISMYADTSGNGSNVETTAETGANTLVQYKAMGATISNCITVKVNQKLPFKADAITLDGKTVDITKLVEFSSSDEKVFSIQDGNIVGLSKGSANMIIIIIGKTQTVAATNEGLTNSLQAKTVTPEDLSKGLQAIVVTSKDLTKGLQAVMATGRGTGKVGAAQAIMSTNMETGKLGKAQTIMATDMKTGKVGKAQTIMATNRETGKVGITQSIIIIVE